MNQPTNEPVQQLETWLHSHRYNLTPEISAQLLHQFSNCLAIIPSHPQAAQATCCGLKIAAHALSCQIDGLTLSVALCYPLYLLADQPQQEAMRQQLTAKYATMLQDMQRIAVAEQRLLTPSTAHYTPAYIETFRGLILSLCHDLRSMVLKLCERLALLQNLNQHTGPDRKQAQYILDIYAPLANRLGIGQLKWQLEDLASRVIDPSTYHRIAKALHLRREEREQILKNIQTELTLTLQQAEIQQFHCSSRAKHITSIMRKLVEKKRDIEHLYDTFALRILTRSVRDCYKTLSTIHSNWTFIASEFNDYIANPKANGYQSIHTIIQIADQPAVEIQIRTFDMHEAAELGIASHWRYKEKTQLKTSSNQNIDQLRQRLHRQNNPQQPSTNSDTDTNSHPESSQNLEHSSSKIFVFTPNHDLIQLPLGATPLDFAYYIHAAVGHCCKGAKVNHNIVPLQHKLKSGDIVSIMKQSHPAPSRDWLNPKYGYLHTRRARQHVAAWFNKIQQANYIQQGQVLWDKHLRLQAINKTLLPALYHSFNIKDQQGLLLLLGSGKIGYKSILNRIASLSEDTTKTLLDGSLQTITDSQDLQAKLKPASSNAPHLTDASGLLMQPAGCCQPIPGDKIIGYITQGRGISMHRPACKNLAALRDHHPQRYSSCRWPASAAQKTYCTSLVIHADNRHGIVHDITRVIHDMQWKLHRIHSRLNKNQQTAIIEISLMLDHLDSLQKVIASLQQLPGVMKIYRQT